MNDDRETRRYVVSGRVQGVGFRWFVEREAATLGITGWVRNRDDGRVEVMATGTRDQLSALHGRLREGPRAARVDEVAVSAAPYLDAKSFGIEGAW
jgi:acylphosphatase